MSHPKLSSPSGSLDGGLRPSRPTGPLVGRGGSPRRWSGVLALALGLATIALAGNSQLKVGDVFPELSQFKLEGPVPSSLAGKIVIVDFWASWCSPCKASFPVLDDLQKEYGDKGLVVIGVNVDDKRADMDEFLKQHKASFTIVRDGEKKLVVQANIETMPTSFVIDPAGKVRSIHNGFHGDATKKQYVAEIEEMLKTK